MLSLDGSLFSLLSVESFCSLQVLVVISECFYVPLPRVSSERSGESEKFIWVEFLEFCSILSVALHLILTSNQ